MRATESIDAAVRTLFEHLDAEAWDTLAEGLHPDAELADELTGEWLRGRERVAAYLRAQRGIVAGIESRMRSLETRWIVPDVGLATFVLEQGYRFDGAARHEHLTGSVIFTFEDGREELLLFHLGAQAVPRESDTAAATPLAPESLGEALRRHRTAARLSLRALGERTGLSASFLSQVERGAAEPSVASLVRLAEALALPLAEMLGTAPGRGRIADRVVRADDRRRVAVPASGLDLELLTDPGAHALEVTVFELAGDAAAQPARAERGERFLYVLEGRMRVTCQGEQVVLDRGDALTVAAGVGYAIEPESGAGLRCLSALVVDDGERRGTRGEVADE